MNFETFVNYTVSRLHIFLFPEKARTASYSIFYYNLTIRFNKSLWHSWKCRDLSFFKFEVSFHHFIYLIHILYSFCCTFSYFPLLDECNTSEWRWIWLIAFRDFNYLLICCCFLSFFHLAKMMNLLLEMIWWGILFHILYQWTARVNVLG